MAHPSSSSSSAPPPPAAEATSLAPGFRFHPTDEELVSYYPKRKVVGRPLKVDAIAELDLYKVGGYWKTTGKDREVRNGPRIVGMKKTIVFHAGRAPKGERTNWVMHEYRLEGDEAPQLVLWCLFCAAL